MLKNVPRAFLVLLTIYFLLEIAGTLLSGSMLYLARIVVVGIAAWRALRGSRPAAIFLAVVMSLGAIAGVYAAYNAFAMNPAGAIVQLIVVALLATIAAYIFLSPKLKSFYATSSASYWSGSQ
jgi:hypothetical protein